MSTWKRKPPKNTREALKRGTIKRARVVKSTKWKDGKEVTEYTHRVIPYKPLGLVSLKKKKKFNPPTIIDNRTPAQLKARDERAKILRAKRKKK